MRIASSGRVLGGIALIATGALVLAGCTTSGTKSAFLPCMVSDAGGFDDHSFNELGYDGLVQASDQLGVTPKKVQSDTENDYAPNIDTLVAQKCDLIITVGFNLSSATLKAAKANPGIDFAIIDDAADANFDGKPDLKNVKPILFNTAEGAFLAGYTAASYSKSGKVATWGGMNFPTVTIFMDGFKQGIDYYNKQKNASVKLLGYNGDPKTATFTGGFEANNVAKSTASNFIDQGADVLLPVGGPIYQSALAAIKDSGENVALIGVDADLFNTDPTTRDVLLTSILKGIKSATADVVTSAAKGDYSNDPYIGTLANDGVGMAPFHNFQSKVSPDLQGELDVIKAGIIDGSIKVKSYLA
ncbi:MAG: BMP family ABC transporter substrate-binding protein [Salinibacterium sp.]|nr:MAG: BMP family ABC transporter substrate-binding protein [Salinibacterium sp.]